jgi:hypothetical protein
MATKMNTVDDFLSHKSSDRSGGFLDKWKKDKTVNIWLHTECLPIAIWRHGFPRLVIMEDDGENVRKFFGGNYNCHEPETTLKKQYKRNADESREIAPIYCPICKLVDWCYLEIAEGRIDFTKLMFRFEATDPKDTVTIHTGGLCNLYGSDDLTAEQKQAMKKAGISPKEAWRENAYAKLSYLFRVVDNANPDKGVQTAIETGLLGDKVKDVIADARESKGEDEGNPFRNPFCIQWEYKENEQVFNKKYHARRIEKYALTPAIEKLIRGPKPDVSRLIEPFDVKTMRAFLERNCVLKGVPWDEIFDVKKREEEDDDDSDAASSDRTPEVATDGDADDATSQGADDEVACDACEKPMKASDAECPHCGEKYDVEAKAPEPPPKQIKKRSEMKKDAGKPDKGKTKKGDEVPF